MGSVINIWGRKLLICDCDEFTKEYYKSKYGIGKLTQIDLDWFYLTNYIILKLVELLYKELKLNKTPFTGFFFSPLSSSVVYVKPGEVNKTRTTTVAQIFFFFFFNP